MIASGQLLTSFHNSNHPFPSEAAMVHPALVAIIVIGFALFSAAMYWVLTVSPALKRFRKPFLAVMIAVFVLTLAGLAAMATRGGP